MGKVPVMTTDAEAEAFLDQDLLDLDFSQFKPVQSEFQAKTERVNMCLPAELLKAVQAKVKAEGMPYQRFIRATLAKAVTREKMRDPSAHQKRRWPS
jgi:predicted DNA binding CopG/RHH family protein